MVIFSVCRHFIDQAIYQADGYLPYHSIDLKSVYHTLWNIFMQGTMRISRIAVALKFESAMT